jgi:hypothetical protein
VSDQIKERLAEGIFWVAALLTIGSLVVIIGYIMIQGLGQLSISFLLENPRQMGSAGGIFSPLLGTIYFTVFTMLLAVPIGVGAAIYLTEFTRGGYSGANNQVFYRCAGRYSINCDRLVWFCFLRCAAAAADRRLVDTLRLTNRLLYDSTYYDPCI